MTSTPDDRPARLSLPRALRIQLKRDFDRAFQRGSRAKGSILTVVAVPNGLAYPRVGLSIGRVIWRGAVGRNRLRRVFRESFRLERRGLPQGFDFVLLAAAPKLSPKLADVRAELCLLADKAAKRALEKARAASESPR